MPQSPRDKSATRLICPLVAPDCAQMRVGMLAAAKAGADAVECRLDFLEIPPSRDKLTELLTDAPVEVIVTNRPVRHGGNFSDREDLRLKILHEAAAFQPTYIDIEMDVPPKDWPQAEIIVSHHDWQGPPADLDKVIRRMDSLPAAVNKVAFAAGGPEDAVAALDVLRNCNRPTLALAMGEAGVVSRILARKFGAFGTFAALGSGDESAPGQPTIEEMKNLYRWDSIGPDTRVFGVIGCPVAHSMSPAIHNAAFEAAGYDGVYLPLLIQPGAENFNRSVDALLQRPWLDWRGLSVTIPHKENALAYVGDGDCDSLAVQIGAVNTLTIEPHGALKGDNTDYAAAIDALCDAMKISPSDLQGRRVAVIGAGGAARAIVAALAYYEAKITIYNRTVSRAKRLGEEFACEAAGLDEAHNTDAEILINCTSVGMHPNVKSSPLDSIPKSVIVVFDTIYNPVRTRLLELAGSAGCTCVTGLDMFVNQGARQFEIWTDRPAPLEVMRGVVMENLHR